MGLIVTNSLMSDVSILDEKCPGCPWLNFVAPSVLSLFFRFLVRQNIISSNQIAEATRQIKMDVADDDESSLRGNTVLMQISGLGD